MLFNSLEFALFLPLVFFLYWFILKNNLKLQNFFIVIVSYIFYGWWDWRFLLLIAFTSFCSYWSGILIEKIRLSKQSTNLFSNAKAIATINIVINLLILCTFKYFNFFSENFNLLFQNFGIELGWLTIDVLLPVGISFYTFQAISYTIDVYRRKIDATHDIVSFFAFVSFFPQLVAGPIERSTNLLPQFYVKRHFDYDNAVQGMRQILLGLFKKIAIADNCAITVNEIFGSYQDASGSTLLLGGVLFAFQIYGDFSGYSDIAIGTSRLFGIRLMRNFHFPYFSRDIAEFWRRWHISLNTWFRDYIYIPLGGSRASKYATIRNTLIIFLVSGLWHGANWTFLAWGLYHALLFMPLLLIGSNRKFVDTVAEGRLFPTISDALRIATTFFLVVIGWIIFRAENITQAIDYISSIFNTSLFSLPTIANSPPFIFGAGAIIILLVIEWLQRNREFALDFSHPKLNSFFRLCLYMLLVLYTFYFGGQGEAFIYFQF